MFFTTTKKITFHSPALFATQLAMSAAVLGYVIVYNCLYKGLHLQRAPVEASINYRIRPPTAPCSDQRKWRAACGRMRYKFATLPYCSVSKIETPLNIKKRCVLNRMEGIQTYDRSLYVPSWIERWRRATSEDHVESFLNGTWQSRREIWQEEEAQPDEEVFVAGVEEMMLEWEHQLHFAGGRNNTGMEMTGYYYPADENPNDDILPDPEKMEVIYHSEEVRKPLKSSRGSLGNAVMAGFLAPHLMQQPPLKPSGATFREGDEPLYVHGDLDASVKINLAGLLKLAGVTLDDQARQNETWRSCGIQLTIIVTYENTEDWPGLKITPWSSPKPWFTVRARRGEPTCGSTFMHQGDQDFIRSRGIDVQVKQLGTLAVWSQMGAMVALTTALTLVGSALKMLEMYLLYCTDWYKNIKYETRELEPDAAPVEEGGLEESQERSSLSMARASRASRAA